MTRSDKVVRQHAALPYSVDDEGRLNILLITSRRTKRWVLPKGWSADNESGPETAGREAEEEAGVRGRIDPRGALGHYHYVKQLKDGSVTCRVTVFPFEVHGHEMNFREKGQRILRWCSPGYGAELVHEPELAGLLRRFGEAGVMSKSVLVQPVGEGFGDEPAKEPDPVA